MNEKSVSSDDDAHDSKTLSVQEELARLRLELEEERRQKEEAVRREEEAVRREEEAVRREEEERRQKEEERRQKEEANMRLGERRIEKDTVLPELNYRDLKTSPVSVRKKGLPAEINEEKRLSALEIEFISCVGKYSRLLGDAKKAPLYWANEKDIQDYIQTLVKDLIEALDLPLQYRPEIQVEGVRPDIWVMYSASGIPVGAIEVKVPVPREKGEKIMEIPDIHGQMFDYLKELQAFHGAKYVVGIVTTYNEWRAYVLKEGQMKRKMDASEVFSRDNSHIFDFVAGCLVRMANTGGSKMENGENRTVVKFEETIRSWHTFSSFPETDDEIPVKDDIAGDVIYVSRMIGRGAFGSVCEAIYKKKGEEKWVRCAVKFTMDEETDLKHECEGWNKAYETRNGGKDVAFVKTFNNHDVLVMPYVEEFKEEEEKIWKHKYKDDVDECIKLLASMKIRHDELESRHVGFRRFNGKFEVWFTDFGRYSRESDGRTDQSLIESMQESLYNEEEEN